MSDGARQKAAEKLNTGEYLIGIGSSGKMGTGINAQKRLAALHHVDAPWLPAFVEQRNGRGHRQGNLNDPTKPEEEQTVESYYYTTEGSFDVVMWQALTRKSKFIEQFMRGDMSVREMRFDDTGDEESGEIGPEMILAATSGNPYELDRVRLIKDIERLEKQSRNHRQQQSRFRTQIAEGGRRRAGLEREIEEYGKDAAQYEATKGQKFSATINGKTYGDRKVAGNQLAVAAVELPPRSNTKIGQYRGFDIFVDKGKERVDAYLKRQEGDTYTFDLNLSEPEGAFNSADANLRYASSHKAKSEERLAALERDVETAKAEVDKPFRRAEELEQKRQKLREIQRSIEELYDQKPGRDVRKLASRLETLKPVMTFVQGGAYDIAEIRQSMADVVPNKAAFDRWLLALQNSDIVHLHDHDDIARRGDPEAYVHDHKTGRYYSDLMMKQGWETKAANVPAITAYIEAEAQTEGHINGYDLEEAVMLEMAKSVDLAQQAYGELYVEQQAQMEGGALASMDEADPLIEGGMYRLARRLVSPAAPPTLLAPSLKSARLEVGERLDGNTLQPLQDKSKTAAELALESIANIEANALNVRKSWKELVVEVGAIAREAITGVNEAASVWDGDLVMALKEIAGIETVVEQEGRLLSDKDRVEEAVRIARAAIGQSESEAVAGCIGINVMEMTPPPQHSRHNQQIDW